MAAPEEIAALRELIGEPDDSNGWTDEKLGAIIDGTETLNEAARTVWISKASSYATLVDVSESGSSRKLSDLHKNALAMAGFYGKADEDQEAEVTGGPVIARIRRGFV